jgi:hypothetical protein
MIRKTIIGSTAAVIAAGASIMSTSAQSDTLSRNNIGSWGDPLTLPQTRTTCVKEASGKWPWGEEWRTCVGWKTESRHMQVTGYFQVDGPKDLSASVRQAANDCAAVAGLTAFGAGIYSGGSGALPAAKIAFEGCISTKAGDVAKQFSISIPTEAGWTDWG